MVLKLVLFKILKFYHLEKRMSEEIIKFADNTHISKALRARAAMMPFPYFKGPNSWTIN